MKAAGRAQIPETFKKLSVRIFIFQTRKRNIGHEGKLQLPKNLRTAARATI
jgi:hypothetical protein